MEGSIYPQEVEGSIYPQVVNADGRVPLDEAGPAHKSAQEVVDAVVGAGLARVEHRLRPLASLKASDARLRRSTRLCARPVRDRGRRPDLN